MNNPADTLAALAPCPFCGGVDIRTGWDDFGWFQVFCGGCNATVEDDVPEKAIAAWNRRASLKGEAVPILKPLEWDDHGDEWMCEKGFHIEDLGDNPDQWDDKRFRAVWGEGEPECFDTLEEAKADCARQWAEFVGGQIYHPTPSPAPQGGGEAAHWKSITDRLKEEVDGYEFRGDEGDYTPNERERMLLLDFAMGLPDELFATPPAQQPGEVGEDAKASARILSIIANDPHGAVLLAKLARDELGKVRAFIDAALATPAQPKASEDVNAVGDEDISEPFPRVHGYDPSGERRTVTVEWRPGEFVGYIRLGDRTKWKEAPPAAYSIDADPAGIRERVASAVLGALMQGAHGTNPPPVGHWLADFWNMARADANHPKASEGKAGGEDDRDRLVGSILDAWEMLPNDLKCEVEECALGKSLDALFNWMENEQPVPSHVKAPRAVRKTGPGSLKASDAKDAARYQWLRERHWSHSDMCVVVSPREVVRIGAHCPSHDSLDTAIDAAMTAALAPKEKGNG